MTYNQSDARNASYKYAGNTPIVAQFEAMRPRVAKLAAMNARYHACAMYHTLTGMDALLAREMGYTGVALKTCKGQSQTLLLAAAAQKYKMFRGVQDLTGGYLDTTGLNGPVLGTS